MIEKQTFVTCDKHLINGGDCENRLWVTVVKG